MTTAARDKRSLGAAIAILLVMAGAILGIAALPRAAFAQPAQLAPPPPGLARVWFLRQFTPGGSLATPWIYINGAPLTTSQPGTIFYHDLVPGIYTFSVESCGEDVGQSQTLQLRPGSQAELEIQSLESFTPRDCPSRGSTFYVRPVAPRFLPLYLPQLADLGAR
jgi:hypothetical protein